MLNLTKAIRQLKMERDRAYSCHAGIALKPLAVGPNKLLVV